MRIFDIHCHVLPGIDDGCATAEESLDVLESSWYQGVDGLAATPHYYPRETVDSFLKRREAAARRLLAALQETPIARPGIVLGAEVAYYSELVHERQLSRLCIGNTDYLLLELPFAKWPQSVLRDIETIRKTRGLIPIIAHLERYLQYQDKNTVRSLLDMDVFIQINAEFILDPKTRRTAKKFLKDGIVQFLGSDSHNMTSRPPNLGEAFDRLLDWGMEDLAEQICENGAYLFSE